MGTRPFTFADTFEVVADTVPDKMAVVTEERRLTYAEVDERATRLAHVLAERGVGAGDHIGLYLFNGTEYANYAFGFISLSALAILTIFYRKGVFPGPASRLAVALLVAGILGNLTDRLLHGYVVDFLHFHWRVLKPHK